MIKKEAIERELFLMFISPCYQFCAKPKTPSSMPINKNALFYLNFLLLKLLGKKEKKSSTPKIANPMFYTKKATTSM
jgi:hypothetical protein